MTTLDWIVVAVYAIAVIFLLSRLKRARTMADFSVASRTVPAGILFGSLAATFVGPGYAMGLIGKASTGGWVWLAIFAGFVLQMLIMAKWIGPALRRVPRASSLPDVMEYAYGPGARILTAVICLVLMAGFVGVIGRAAAQIVDHVTGFGIGWSALIACTVVVAYTTIGGMRADLLLDCLHFVIHALAMPILLIALLLAPSAPEAVAPTSTMPWTTVASLFIAFMLGEALIPPYTARALAASDERSARQSFLWGGLFGLAWFALCCAIGTRLAVVAPASAGDGAFNSAVAGFMPTGLQGLMFVVALSIAMSAWDSVLNGASVTFANDLQPALARALGSKRTTPSLGLAKAANVVLGVTALIFALNAPSIIDALMICYSLWVPTVVLPAAIGALYPGLSRRSAVPAIIAGGICTALWQWALKEPAGIPSRVVGLLANQVVFWLVYVFTKPRLSQG